MTLLIVLTPILVALIAGPLAIWFHRFDRRNTEQHMDNQLKAAEAAKVAVAAEKIAVEERAKAIALGLNIEAAVRELRSDVAAAIGRFDHHLEWHAEG